MYNIWDTIAAISTPPGEGALAIVRISGKESIAIAEKLFRGRASLSTAATHTAHFGNFLSPSGEVIDTVVATLFRAPHSYTGEDLVEFTTHGGYLISRRVLEGLLQQGARLARPGEFTLRAFLNGKLDLAQAEAVADLIAARTEASRRASLRQLQGMLSSEIRRLRDSLVELCGLLEVELDFADEDVEFVDRRELKEKFESAIEELGQLLLSYSSGKLIRDGVRVVIVGSPNVGKSSLLNALLSEDRAIVSTIPGTTRDTIEVDLAIEGVLFRIVDTAGLRESVDEIEREGVRRAHRQISSADAVLIVFDQSRPLSEEEINLLRRLQAELKGEIRTVVVWNKSDLPSAGKWKLSIADLLNGCPDVEVSALTGDGIDRLKKLLLEISVGDVRASEAHPMLVSARHKEAVERALNSLRQSLQSLEKGESGEFICVDLRAAIDALGEIIGVVTTDDILDTVFSKFCIGK